MTPFEKVGYKSTDKFEVIGRYACCFNFGDIVTLVHDDNSSAPKFKNQKGYEGHCNLNKLLLIEPEWNGEGLPPVGTICEVYHNPDYAMRTEVVKEGTVVEVLAHHKLANSKTVAIVYWGGEEDFTTEAFVAECLRPLNTNHTKSVNEPIGYATRRDGNMGSWLFSTKSMAENHDSTALGGKPANSEIIPLYSVPQLPDEMTPEMMKAVQLHSEMGAYATDNLSGAYDLFQEFWKIAITAHKKAP